MSKNELEFPEIKSECGKFTVQIRRTLKEDLSLDPRYGSKFVHEGRCNGKDVVVKVYSYLEEDVDSYAAEHAKIEIDALRTLTLADCKHSPHLIIDFQKMSGKEILRYIVMTKVPGRPIEDGEWEQWSKEERARIEEAFEKARDAVGSCQISNGDPFYGNLVYDRAANKCYIVDFEMAEASSEMLKSTFEEWIY